jgi:hypothetical protein
MEKNAFLSMVVFIIVSAVPLSSCSTGFAVQVPAKRLDAKAQSMDREHGYSAIGVWSLHIEDDTDTFAGWDPIFSIGPLGAARNLCNYLKTGQAKEMTPAEALSKYAKVKPVEGSWTKNGGKAFYNGLFVVELQQGEREFFHVRLENQDVNAEKWFSIPLNAPCRIEANKIYDLHQLEIAIIAKTIGNDGKFHFNYEVRSPDKDFSNRSKLGAQYPQLDIRGDHFVPGCAFRGPDTICQ